MNVDRKTILKIALYVVSTTALFNCVSTLQEKQYLAKQKIRQVLSSKAHEYPPLWRVP